MLLSALRKRFDQLLLLLVHFFSLDRNGSVVVFFTIIFNKVVHIDDAILVLKNASEYGTLGDLKIEPGSIKALLPVATTPATTSPKETATTTPTSGKLIWHVFKCLINI